MAPTTTFVHGFLRLCLLGGWHRGSGVLVTHCAAGSDSADRASGSKNTIHKCPSPKSPVRFLRREWTAAVRVRVPSCANRRWREWPSPQGKPKAWKKMEKRLKGRGTDHWSMEGCEHGRTCWVDGPKQISRSYGWNAEALRSLLVFFMLQYDFLLVINLEDCESDYSIPRG